MWAVKGLKFRKDRLWLLLIPLSIWFITQYQFAWNETESLPQTLFFIQIGKLPNKGDYVIFYAPPTSYFKPNDTLIKQVIGVADDIVTQANRMFYINGEAIALAKTHSLKGRPLIPGPVGVIPAGQYFVWTEHKDSYDSRYQEIGWIDESRIFGTAYPLF